jgi:predicted negative regulator of RcsB-dependent stress response
MNDETQTQSLDQTLDQTLEKTDLGHIINENKKLIMIALGVILALIVGYSVYKNQAQKTYNDNLGQVFAFQTEVVDQYNTKKLTDTQYIEKVKAMPTHLTGQPTLVPALFTSLNTLVANGKTVEVISILETWVKHFSTSSYMYYFIGLKLAPLYEDTTQHDKAITILQSLIASKLDVVKSRLYLDSGRVFLKKGDKVKARENFEFITKNYKDTEMSKIAKLYLQGL